MSSEHPSGLESAGQPGRQCRADSPMGGRPDGGPGLPSRTLTLSPFFCRDGRVIPLEVSEDGTREINGHRYRVTSRGEWPLVSYDLELIDCGEELT